MLSKIRFVFLSLIFYFQVSGQQAPLSSNAIFAPIVTATCRAGLMTVKVETLDNFLGVVQSRDYRKPECSGYGENSKITYLRVNMLAKSSDPEYCGVFINEVRMIIRMFSFCHRFSFNESTTIQHTVEDNFEQKNVLLEQSALISRIMKNRPNSRKNSNESLKLQPYIKKVVYPYNATRNIATSV